MSTVTPRIQFETQHGAYSEDWPCVPRIGEHVVVPNEDHGPERAERVVLVVWSSQLVRVIAECEPVA